MPKTPSRFAVLAVAILLAAGPARTQQGVTSSEAASTSAPAGASVSQEDLDRLMAPIALYPDPLIAQILMASTYPLEVVLAARWSKENPGVTGTALEDAMQKQTWDPAVKSLTSVPQVLKQMNDNLGWMQKLGDAFLADQQRVLDTVQSLRAKAQAAGTLKSTPEQTVRTETQESKTVIVIEPAQPGKIYVPTYDPYYAYGPWWYSYPPYYMYPYGYYYAPGLAFATGVLVGAAIWGGIGWGGNNVYVDHRSYNNFNRTNIGNGDRGNWGHNVDHRRGVAYGDNGVAQRFNRGGDAKGIQSREQFRARADQGRAQLGSMDRGQLQNQVANRGTGPGGRAGGDLGGRGSGDFGGRGGGSVSTRPSASVGGGTRDFASRGGSGFSGAGLGQSSRAASSRGSSSRGSMSASRGGGGRGGGRR